MFHNITVFIFDQINAALVSSFKNIFKNLTDPKFWTVVYCAVCIFLCIIFEYEVTSMLVVMK